MSQNSTIKLKFVNDSFSELKLVETNTCTFAINDRSPSIDRPWFMVTTMKDEVCELPGWRVEYQGGTNKLKRFDVKISKNGIIAQLKSIYGEENVIEI